MVDAIAIFEEVLSKDERLEIQSLTECANITQIKIDVYLMCQFCHIILDKCESDILVGYRIRNYYSLTPFLMGSLQPVLIFDGDSAVLKKIQQYADTATAAVYAIESIRQLHQHASDMCHWMKLIDLIPPQQILDIPADDLPHLFEVELEKIKFAARNYFASVCPDDGLISLGKS